MARDPDKASRFLQLHHEGWPLLMPNSWDASSTKLLASLGFTALATTSSGSAASLLGKLDGSLSREQALDHAASVVSATDVPVSADLEDCFAADPAGVAATVEAAVATGLAGCSIEDFTRDRDDPIYELEHAVERVAAAAEAAHSDGPFVLTARAEDRLHGRDDLAATIARLQRYQEAGADVLFAPGVASAEDIRAVVSSVDLPVNVIVVPGVPPVAQLAELGVRRVSVGGAFAYTALGAVLDAGRELLDDGTYGYLAKVGAARADIRASLS